MTTKTAAQLATILSLNHAAAMASAKEEANTPESNWYPCGFATVFVKTRKNGVLATALIGAGYRHSDYDKGFSISLPMAYCLKGMEQSMDYAARCLRAYLRTMTAAGFEGMEVRTRID